MPIGFHPVELVAILAIALLIFGPKRLPEMGASIGKSIKEFQKGMRELKDSKEEESSAASLAAIEREIASKRAADTVVETPVNEVDTKETKIN